VGVVLSARGKETTSLSTPSSTPTVSPTHSERFVEVRDVLGGVSGDALLDESSYQYKAFEWIVRKDAMQVSSQSTSILVERYIIALWYFATNGPSWSTSYGFLQSTSVCKWNNAEYGIFCSDDGRVGRIYFRRYCLVHMCMYNLFNSSDFSFPMTIRRQSY
jgi:hypothetical protein